MFRCFGINVLFGESQAFDVLGQNILACNLLVEIWNMILEKVNITI